MQGETPAVKKDRSAKVFEILDLEARAIERAASVLDPQAIEQALDVLSACQGKVIVTGVGKSGVIAQKIAQTMTSTGTTAVFLHPSDALHGGLGVLDAGDAVIALSNSGETDEILMMLPALRQRGLPLISIVGNSDSTLARRSHIVLDSSVDREACPLNLAPTTSTTVSLAIGDALAMALMETKGMTEQDFAANHPAGRLGKRLTLTVADLMHPSPNVTRDAGWLDVVKSLSAHGLGAVNVVTGDELDGIITDGDLRRTIERTSPEALTSVTASQMMTALPISVEPSVLAYEALRIMEDRPRQISVLPVVAEGRCVGLLRLHDIVRSGL